MGCSRGCTFIHEAGAWAVIVTVRVLHFRLNHSLQHALIINAEPCVVERLQDLQELVCSDSHTHTNVRVVTRFMGCKAVCVVSMRSSEQYIFPPNPVLYYLYPNSIYMSHFSSPSS